MTEFGFTDALLTAVVAYGVPVLAVALLGGLFGLPVPVTLLALAAGAQARQDMVDPLLYAGVRYLRRHSAANNGQAERGG